MLDNLSGLSMPFSIPGTPPPSDTGSVVAPPPASAPVPAPVSSPMAGPVPPNLFPLLSQFDPANARYTAETQSDGTILLRIQNPDGTPGPVVQHLPPPKMKGASGPTAKG